MALLRKIVASMPVIEILDTTIDAMYYLAKIRRNYIDQLCTHPKLWIMDDKKEWEELQYKAIKQAFIHHYKRCKFYHDYCKMKGIKPDDINSIDDIIKIPQIPAETFRQGGIISVPASKLRNVGSSGSPLYTVRDTKSAIRLIAVVLRVFINAYLPELIEFSHKKNYRELAKFWLNNVSIEAFIPPPEESLIWGVQVLRVFTPLLNMLQIPYTFHLKKFDEKKALDTIREHSKENKAMWFWGFPYVIEKLMSYMEEHNEPSLELDPTGSNLCGFVTGGGWEALTGEKIDKKEFGKRLKEHFGFNENLIIDFRAFGEADAVAADFCRIKIYHLWPNAKCVVRDPETLEPCVEGEKGLMSVYNPAINCYPAFLVCEDLARISDIQKCECGAFAQNFKFEGKYKGRIKS
jgi:long-chain-fatty-acid---luciferin-component ligase